MMNGHPSSVMPVSGLSVSPSVARQAAVFGRQISMGPRGLVSSLHSLYVPQPGSIISYNHEEAQRQVNITNYQDNNLGTPEKSRQPPSPVESGVGQGPADKAAYKRFNGKEQKEREATAENWINAEVKRRVFSNRKAPLPTIQLVKPGTFVFEYAMYTKDHSFIKIIRKAVAGMVVRQPAFTCCTRGTTDAGTPV